MAVAALALACGGNTVDLGQRDQRGFSDLEDMPPAAPNAAPTPQTIYDGEARLIAYTVDETYLYALLDVPEDRGQLVRCPIDRCRSERTILARGVGSEDETGLSSPTSLFLVSNSLFWLYGTGYPATGVARCSTAGCEGPTFTEPAQLWGDLAADAAHVYWVDGEGWLRRWATDGSAAERLRDLNGSLEMYGPLIGDVLNLAVAGDYVFFLQEDLGIGAYLSRIRKDGSSDPEVLAQLEDPSSIGATTTEAYYTSQTLAGSLRGLPAGGGEERVVASNQRWPTSLQLNGSEAFWVNVQQPEAQLPVASLLSCTLPSCSATKTWIGNFELAHTGFGSFFPDASRHVALNSRWLLWLERGAAFGSKLRRLPR
jgi:hypothetical protein